MLVPAACEPCVVCRACSQKQAAAVRTGKRTLRMHFAGLQPWHFAGALPLCCSITSVALWQSPGRFDKAASPAISTIQLVWSG